mmetsp:Transcript_38413/g.88039  ORF Transcript_38413/g.88039 Transcript_38413/m.88039 type:complete len:398 (+) Transcript_38413:62-1255(+)
MPLTISPTAVYAPLQVLDLVAGQIPVPREITHIVLEIGCNGHNWLWNNILPVPVPGIAANVPIANQSHVLLISFEPLLDKYALYLSHQKRLDALRGNLVVERPFSPGWSVPGRAIVLPLAVGGPPDGDADFSVARSDGCSSLLRINSSKARGTFSRWSFGMSMCGQAVSTRRVPVVSLETVLQRWLPGRRIAFIKIDAQGYDVYAARSAGLALNRIDAIQIEMTADKCGLPYHDAPSCTEAVLQMSELGTPGFSTNGNCSQPRHFTAGSWGCNSDFVFWPTPLSPAATEKRRIELGALSEPRFPDIRGRTMPSCCPEPLFKSSVGFASKPSDCDFICRLTAGCHLFSHSLKHFDCLLCPHPPRTCMLSSSRQSDARLNMEAPRTWSVPRKHRVSSNL